MSGLKRDLEIKHSKKRYKVIVDEDLTHWSVSNCNTFPKKVCTILKDCHDTWSVKELYDLC